MRQTFANVLAEVDPERLEQVLRVLTEQLDLPDCSDDAAGMNRDRGPDCSGTPPTPPSMRVRTRRFDAWEQACSRE